MAIRIKDLPTEDEIGDLYANDVQHITVPVHRKNRGHSNLYVPLRLAAQTLSYILNDGDRNQIVQKSPDRRRSSYVFLSEKGGQLTADSVTRICGKFFRDVEIDKANIHRLRARFVTEIIEQCLDDLVANGQSVDINSDWTESILVMAQRRMGHSHISSLRPYLNEIKIRRVQRDGAITKRCPTYRDTEIGLLVGELLSSFHEFGEPAFSTEARALVSRLRDAVKDIDTRFT